MNKKNYELLLEWYEKDPGEKFIGEEEVYMTEDELAVLMGKEPSRYPFSGGACPLQVKKDIDLIQKLVLHKIDLSSYDYFIIARAI